MLQSLREFFAEAKSEFKKISWPSVDEVKGSTLVVCVTITFLMALLAAYDFGIMGMFKTMHSFFSK
jgi:preprotein translocase SecE subunit